MIVMSEFGIAAIGRKEYQRFVEGKKLSPKRAALARCYWCMNGYVDGKNDCGITDCPLYRYMPYASSTIEKRNKSTPKKKKAVESMED